MLVQQFACRNASYLNIKCGEGEKKQVKNTQLLSRNTDNSTVKVQNSNKTSGVICPYKNFFYPTLCSCCLLPSTPQVPTEGIFILLEAFHPKAYAVFIPDLNLARMCPPVILLLEKIWNTRLPN